MVDTFLLLHLWCSGGCIVLWWKQRVVYEVMDDCALRLLFICHAMMRKTEKWFCIIFCIFDEKLFEEERVRTNFAQSGCCLIYFIHELRRLIYFANEWLILHNLFLFLLHFF